ncbi:MAG: chemotaxis response regulator protein-glutamate methylesterase [Gammaproteobacteria bacterium]
MRAASKSVLIVDDSKAMREFLSQVINQDPELEVVGQAADPFEARKLIKQLNPDVMTLDVEMPGMDGITFLRNVMRLRPMPVVMLSMHASSGARVSIDALTLGAIDVVHKRNPSTPGEMLRYTRQIQSSVRMAARSLVSTPSVKRNSEHPDFEQWAKRLRKAPPASDRLHRLIALGASTGGPGAINQLLENMALPGSCVVLCQHMQAEYLASFAERLNTICSMTVKLAQDGETLDADHVYVAPGGQHLAVQRAGSKLLSKIIDAPRVNDHRPAVDVLFNSVARTVGGSALGLLLTGMGQDGAEGLKAMHEAGGVTIAQDEASSTIWGMPGSAVRLRATDAVLPLDQIGPICERLALIGDNAILA